MGERGKKNEYIIIAFIKLTIHSYLIYIISLILKTYKVGIIVPILQIKKLRFRKIKYLAQSYRTSTWWSKNLNAVLSNPEFMLLTLSPSLLL